MATLPSQTPLGAASRVGLLLVLCLGLVACPRPMQPPAPAPSVPPPPSAPSPPPPDSAAEVYEIDTQASAVHIHVFRGGTLARLGHNHVITSQSVTGRVWLHPQFTASGFELSFPVADLVVDDPKARQAAGSEFPPEIPAADKEGTKKNMLRLEVLDAERHPRVTIRSASISGSLQSPRITARITIKDVSRDVVVPASVAVNGKRLTARGEFEIRQTEFGMKPFSVALGALAVQDQLRVRFDLVAEKR